MFQRRSLAPPFVLANQAPTVLAAVALQHAAAMRTDLMSMRHEAAFHLVVVGNAAAEMYRVAAARGLLFPATPVLSKSGRGRGGDQRDNQDELASHDMPFWLRFRRLIGPGAVPPNVDAPLPVRAHAKSDVSDLASANAEIGNCRFRMVRTDLPHKGGGNRSKLAVTRDSSRRQLEIAISGPPSAARACRARRKCLLRRRAPSCSRP